MFDSHSDDKFAFCGDFTTTSCRLPHSRIHIKVCLYVFLVCLFLDRSVKIWRLVFGKRHVIISCSLNCTMRYKYDVCAFKSQMFNFRNVLDRHKTNEIKDIERTWLETPNTPSPSCTEAVPSPPSHILYHHVTENKTRKAPTEHIKEVCLITTCRMSFSTWDSAH